MKFSIVTPSYNQGQFISQTIDSVITQKGDIEIEYFVYDGGSSDDTVKILKKYENILKNNPKIKFYWQSKPDKGQSDAINQAFFKATGDIFAYINSDDYYQPDTFQQIAKNLNNHLWITGYSHIINENNQIIQKPITIYKNLFINHYSYILLLVLNFVSQPSTFFRKELFQKFGPFDEHLHLTMDYNFWLSIGAHHQPKIIRKYISNFRIHSSSKGKSGYLQQFSEDLATARNHTSNHAILFLHKLHNHLITFIYRIIK